MDSHSLDRRVILIGSVVPGVAAFLFAAYFALAGLSTVDRIDAGQSTKDRFPLHKAVYERDYDTIKALRDDNRRLYEADMYGRWPIDVAVEVSDDEAIRLLLGSRFEGNRRVSSITRKGLSTAVEHRHLRSVESILRHTVKRPSDESYSHLYANVLLTSVLNEELEIARALVEFGVDPNAKAFGSLPAFNAAVSIDDVKFLNLMLEHGANLALTDKYGMTALDFCLQNSDSDQVLLRLLERGMDARHTTSRGMPSAARCRLRSHLDILIEHGVDLGQTDEDGDTLLHNAVRAFNPEGIRLFIEAGIDRNATNADGLTALELAIKESSDAVVKALKDK